MRTGFFMWRTALEDSKKRPFIGVGFIPEIPSYVSPELPNTGNYEKTGSPPVSGPHNSYLSIFVRMGVPGIILFVLPVGLCLFRMVRYIRSTGGDPLDLLLFYVVANGFIYCMFNVGLESPTRAFALWLAFGVLLARSSGLPIKK
jgi:O-antigen ligase